MQLNTNIYSNAIILSLRKHLEECEYKYITYPKFIFLCGEGFHGEEEYLRSNRGILDQYIRKFLPDTHIILSEKLWQDDFDSNIDLLMFEEFLAEISDAIILFVESPGSFCELGAFAYADNLFSDKLIIILDQKHQHSKSFIATGPVLKAKNAGSKIIYAQIEDGAVLSSAELRNEIINLTNALKSKQSAQNKRFINFNSDKVYISSFLLEILEILRVAQPISVNDILPLYKRIKQFESFTFIKRDGSKFNNEIKFQYILKLLQTAGIIDINSSIVRLRKYENIQNLSLKYYGQGIERERNKIICRKYRYGEQL